MWLVYAALRHPITVLVATLGLMLGASIAVVRMPRDIFPDLQMPVVYLTQTWPGYTPAQIEGLLVSRYEEHLLYIAGIEHIESRSVQGVTMLKLFFHPGTDTSYAVAQVTAMTYRAVAFMPAGTQPPFIMRLDQGAIPAAQLVFESETRDETEIQDLALFRVRPIMATLPGVSAPPPYGGKARMLLVTLDPLKLRRYNMSADEVAIAVAELNVALPEGLVRLDGKDHIPLGNITVPEIKDLNAAPLRVGPGATVYVRDVGKAEDAGDVFVNTAHVDGRRAVYLPILKRAGASTLAVMDSVLEKLPEMRNAIPEDISVRVEFDQSIYVRNAIKGLALEGLLGSLITGLAVALFLRNLRSAILVVISIPTSILMAVVGLALTGQTINIMTLGGLALSVGILVDEAAVEVENVHAHLARGKSPALAVRDAMREVRIPRLVAMLCVCAVFIPTFYMVGISRALFSALALAVAYAMISSYLITSTLVPVVGVWILRAHGSHEESKRGLFPTLKRVQDRVCRVLLPRSRVVVLVFLAVCGVVVASIGGSLGRELFPVPNSNAFQLRIRGPEGMRLEETEKLSQDILKTIDEEVGVGNVEISISNLGSTPGMYPITAQWVWNSGTHEGLLMVALKPDRKRSLPRLQDALRGRFASRFPGVTFSFEPADVVSQVLSGSTLNSLALLVTGNEFAQIRAYAESIQAELAKEPAARDVSIPHPLDMPTLQIDIDRERAGQLGVTSGHIGRSLVPATWSSQWTNINLWVELKTGLGYFLAVWMPENTYKSLEDFLNVPVAMPGQPRPLLRDVATVKRTVSPGAFDHWNGIRTIPITANAADRDLGALEAAMDRALARAGEPPAADIKVLVRGQVQQMRETLRKLAEGLLLAVIVVTLLLAATFQSFRDAFAVLLTIPGVLLGVVVSLALTNQTLNIQSFMGTIMCVGVAVANAVLVVKFFEDRRKDGMSVARAARSAATARLRAVLMTAIAMLAGISPMALGLGEAGEQNAPLGIAVMGGLSVSTVVTLFILPAFLAFVHGARPHLEASLDPDDPASSQYLDETLLQVVFTTRGQTALPHTASAVDLSEGGIMLKTKAELENGARLALEFQLRDEVIKPRARVVHTGVWKPRPGQPDERFHYVYGCVFEELSAEEATKLHQFVLARRRANVRVTDQDQEAEEGGA